MECTAVIRTLGLAGNKYQALLNSLTTQTLQPTEILVFIANGCQTPKETINKEHYVFVKKGMMAQRALSYKEVKTEYILFLDDDVYLPPKAVEYLYGFLCQYNADIISPDVFPINKRSLLGRFMMSMSGRQVGRRDDGRWGYKVMRTSGFSYNSNPSQSVYLSTTNAGPCFFMKKQTFLNIHLEEELWMDKMPYSLGDDQTMYYKMYLMGLKQLTLFGSGIKHLDAGTTLQSSDKEKKLIESDFFFKVVFWHRFIFKSERNKVVKLWSIVCILYALCFSLSSSCLRLRFDILKVKWNAIIDAVLFMKGDEYKAIPAVPVSDNKEYQL